MYFQLRFLVLVMVQVDLSVQWLPGTDRAVLGSNGINLFAIETPSSTDFGSSTTTVSAGSGDSTDIYINDDGSSGANHQPAAGTTDAATNNPSNVPSGSDTVSGKSRSNATGTGSLIRSPVDIRTSGYSEASSGNTSKHIELSTFRSSDLPTSTAVPSNSEIVSTISINASPHNHALHGHGHGNRNQWSHRHGGNRDRLQKRTASTPVKIRGVNLGSLFVMEPWMAETTWTKMGCGSQNAECDCVQHLGQAQANTTFEEHWSSWITQDDIAKMQIYGLNTLRIPLGYWIMESLVDQDETFPQGGFAYLEKICGWASDAGFYIILDLHGAPKAQTGQNADTGIFAESPGFYIDDQFDRATRWLTWITTQVHQNQALRGVGMIEILNEPVQNPNRVGNLTSYYYPAANKAIRDVEANLGISSSNQLHIQAMSGAWGSGSFNGTGFVAADSHRYLKYAKVAVDPSSYLQASCTDNQTDGNIPTIVGEFSLSPPEAVESTSPWNKTSQKDFYKQWFAAQVLSYERTGLGWIFWSWKTELSDYRWSYEEAANLTVGVIPQNLDDVVDPCGQL